MFEDHQVVLDLAATQLLSQPEQSGMCGLFFILGELSQSGIGLIIYLSKP